MFKLVSSKLEKLTPELAKRFAKMPGTVGERPLNPSRLEYLAQKIRECRFHTPRWAIGLIGNKEYRVNGQHSSTVLSQLNGDFPKGLKVQIDTFQCDGKDDLPELFEQFDPPISSRSRTDLAVVHARLHKELDGIAPTNLFYIIQGIAAHHLLLEEVERLDMFERANLIHNNIDFALFAHSISKAPRLAKPGLIAAAYETWRLDRADAELFWTQVVDRSNPDPKHPTRLLGNFMCDGLESDKQRTMPTSWDTRAYYAKCIHAWNAWRRNVTTKMKYSREAALPSPV